MKLNIFVPETNKHYAAAPGSTLLSVLQHHRQDVPAPCGGKGTCRKCLVTVKGLGEILSCQQILDEQLWQTLGLDLDQPLEVHLPQQQAVQFAESSLLPDTHLEPLVCRGEVTLAPATLANPQADDTRFEQASGSAVPFTLLNDLHLHSASVKAPIHFDFRTDTLEVVRFVDTPATPMLGCAFDLGTTTVAAYLFDLKTGHRLAHLSCMNPQKTFGADVISRIEYASTSPEHLERLQQVLTDLIQSMADELLKKVRHPSELYAGSGAQAEQATTPGFVIRKEDILVLTLAGNTTLMHLLTGLNPARIAVAPFVPVSLKGRIVPSSELGINLGPHTLAVLLPSIASYVGADLTAGILACGLEDAALSAHPAKTANRVLLDIGTNGELILAGPSGILACATAAGPAFEGANIDCGMPALAGAIDQVCLEDGSLLLSSISGQVKGICGSGLVALVATLLDAGVIDETGRLLDPDELDDTVSASLRQKIGKIGSHKVFALSETGQQDGKTGNWLTPPAVYLSQKDIRELQNAKAAIAAGLLVLLDVAGLAIQDIERLDLAGGFGNYLNVEQAIRIGLLPETLYGRIRSVGNSSGLGASLCLLNDQKRQLADKFCQKVRYIELSGDRRFNDAYIDAMLFPEE
ncbi:MAG: ASKHA domain-containing protein [Eubacteriales bacterium]|nr:ASKHA domain-containing protein [Eubacteriales bacterium]